MFHQTQYCLKIAYLNYGKHGLPKQFGRKAEEVYGSRSFHQCAESLVALTSVNPLCFESPLSPVIYKDTTVLGLEIPLNKTYSHVYFIKFNFWPTHSL